MGRAQNQNPSGNRNWPVVHCFTAAVTSVRTRKIKGRSQAGTLSRILSEKIQFGKSRASHARGIKSGQRKFHKKAKLAVVALKPKFHMGRSGLGVRRSRNRALESRKPSRMVALDPREDRPTGTRSSDVGSGH
jgi:hypothetical protein